jgi:hypothetical protein
MEEGLTQIRRGSRALVKKRTAAAMARVRATQELEQGRGGAAAVRNEQGR